MAFKSGERFPVKFLIQTDSANKVVDEYAINFESGLIAHLSLNDENDPAILPDGTVAHLEYVEYVDIVCPSGGYYDAFITID